MGPPLRHDGNVDGVTFHPENLRFLTMDSRAHIDGLSLRKIVGSMIWNYSTGCCRRPESTKVEAWWP
jgi:hypothetical protein